MLNKRHYQGYSFALLELAKANLKVNEFKEQSEVLISVFKRYPEYLRLLNSYTIDFKTKEKLLRDVFKAKLDLIIYRMLFILIKKNKINNIVNILTLYVNQINKINKIHEGIIYTQIKLSSKELKDIENTTAKKLDTDITLVNIIDKKIIAGFKIVINDIIIDATIMNQLQLMKQDIINDNK